MSYSGVGGFQGGDALLAFAAIQQGRMNHEMTESMRIADLRSQMAGDLADIKAHLDVADKHNEEFLEVDKEMQAFLEKYGEEAALEDVTSTVRGIHENIHGQCEKYEDWVKAQRTNIESSAFTVDSEVTEVPGTADDILKTAKVDAEPLTARSPLYYQAGTVKNWTDQITEKLDASGTNDQLAMIHIKQLNDNINNSSGMVSGIIESRNNATSSIINNIA